MRNGCDQFDKNIDNMCMTSIGLGMKKHLVGLYKEAPEIKTDVESHLT